MSDVVLVEVTDRIGLVTLNRPESRNALNRALSEGVVEAVAALDADPAVEVTVITGADPAFCAGVDLKEFGSGAATADRPEPGAGRNPWRGVFRPRTKPLIGAVNGTAVTGGLEVALNCDFLIASDRARFADTHARVGVMPGWGLTVLLAQRVGVARAREMSITGNFVDAQTALAWGLVNHVVPHEEVVAYARQIARDVTTIDTRAVQRMLQTYAEISDTTVAEAWDIELQVSKDWEGQGYDLADIEARREGIVARGRSQTGSGA